MQKITFALPEIKEIDINGQVYGIHKGDIDILEETTKYMRLLSALPKTSDISYADTVVSAFKGIYQLLEECLGTGSVNKIHEDRPVSYSSLVKLLGLVNNAVAAEYNLGLSMKYDDSNDNATHAQGIVNA